MHWSWEREYRLSRLKQRKQQRCSFIQFVILLIITCIFYTWWIRGRKDSQKRSDILESCQTLQYTELTLLAKDVASLACLGGQRMFYNRVPKCGSTSVLETFKEFKRSNDYAPVLIRSFTRLANAVRKEFFEEEKSHSLAHTLASISYPYIYEQHVALPFKQLPDTQPLLFINVIRQPLARLESQYKFHQAEAILLYDSFRWPENTSFILETQQLFGLNFEYFCGTEKLCSRNEEGAFEKAKKNVRNYYIVVGVTENLNAFYEVLEFLLPIEYYNVASFSKDTKENILSVKGGFSSELKKELEKELMLEKKFYNWVEQRFFELYKIIVKAKHENYKNIVSILRNPSAFYYLKEISKYLPQKWIHNYVF